MTESKKIAEILLNLKAVSISPQQPYTWASGLKSPIYCDNRLVISTVEERRSVCQAFVNLIAEKGWQPNLIAGTATAGIPHAAWVAEAMSLPMIYVRSSEKKHGKQNLIEGRIPADAHVVVIEDLISTGGSSVKAADAVVAGGAKVLGVGAIFQYGMEKSKKRFAESGYDYATLTNLEHLLDVAISKGLLSQDDRKLVAEWRLDPPAWSDKYGSPA